VTALRVLVLTVGVAIGVIMPFGPVILQSLGFGPGAIGFILSIGAVAIAAAIPAWGHLADVRLGRPRTLQVCAIAAAVTLLALLVAWPPLILATLFVVFWVFQSAWQQLSDAITINMLRGRGIRYGRIRWLTSLSFAIATIVAGFIYRQAGYGTAFVIAAGTALVMAGASLGIPDVARADLAAHDRSSSTMPPGSSSRPRGWRLGSAGVALRVAPRLGLILVAIALVHVGVISGNTFLGLRLIELGGGPSDVALSAGISALAEIPSMMVVGWVASRVGLRGLFAISAGCYAICLAGWAVLDVPALIIASRLLTGVAYAAMTVGVVLTMASILPPELQATGQGLFQTTAFGATAVVANVVGGLLYSTVGSGAVFGLGAIAAVGGGVVGWFAFPRGMGRPEMPTSDAIMADT
jgi:MFS transporter, PPP family, 3-phenylpropionic acid transporter